MACISPDEPLNTVLKWHFECSLYQPYISLVLSSLLTTPVVITSDVHRWESWGLEKDAWLAKSWARLKLKSLNFQSSTFYIIWPLVTQIENFTLCRFKNFKVEWESVTDQGWLFVKETCQLKTNSMLSTKNLEFNQKTKNSLHKQTGVVDWINIPHCSLPPAIWFYIPVTVMYLPECPGSMDFCLVGSGLGPVMRFLNEMTEDVMFARS